MFNTDLAISTFELKTQKKSFAFKNWKHTNLISKGGGGWRGAKRWVWDKTVMGGKDFEN